MAKSLLFIPDISGFTHFVKTTEVEHSQHVISELLEVLIQANTQSLKLAEIEGDALFFYKEEEVPSQEKLLAQVETMYTAFYSHLKLMETNRICPCQACASAPELQLKIIIHSGELHFLNVQQNHKPFGEAVIEAHRLLKNSVPSDNYALLSEEVCTIVGLPESYESNLFRFLKGEDRYDDKVINYRYSEIDTEKLNLYSFTAPHIYKPEHKPNYMSKMNIDTDVYEVYEMITNYRRRHDWVEGVDEFKFNENEVTRIGTEHTCVINGKHFDFTTVVKEATPDQLVYGELTFSPPPVERLYQFYILESITDHQCSITVEQYWETKSLFQKMVMELIGKKQFRKGIETSLNKLKYLLES